MKKLLFIALLSCLSAGIYAQNKDPRPVFAAQVLASCTGGLKMEKSLTNKEGGKETHTFDLDCTSGKARNEQGEEIDLNLGGELFYAMESWAGDPRLMEYFEFTQQGDTLIARLRPEAEGESGLQSQKLLWKDGRLLYVESVQSKVNFLYEQSTRCAVWFDAKGQYQRHCTELYTNVSLSRDLESRIEGRRVP